MKRTLRMKCPSCGHWNRVPVNKIFVEQPSPDPKVKIMIPMYEPLKVSECKKCRKVIAEPKELIRILKSKDEIFSE
jgi:RNase P subunit RPR2